MNTEKQGIVQTAQFVLSKTNTAPALGTWTLTAGLSEKEPVHEGGRGSQVVSAFMQVLPGLLATEHKRSCEDPPCATQAFLLA